MVLLMVCSTIFEIKDLHRFIATIFKENKRNLNLNSKIEHNFFKVLLNFVIHSNYIIIKYIS